MIRILGKRKPKDEPPDTSQTIQKVDARVESVENKIAKLELEMKKYKDQLSKMREGPAKEYVKEKAIRVLKQKKIYESQVQGLKNQSFNMEQTNYLAEAMKDTRATITTMQIGVKSMKKEIKKINIEKVEDLQDEMADLLNYHAEVQDAMGRTYETPDIDDDELQAELEALGDEIALDDDSSYLDEIKTGIASSVPAKTEIMSPRVPAKDPGTENSRENDHAIVDEFGLPKLPATFEFEKAK